MHFNLHVFFSGRPPLPAAATPQFPQHILDLVVAAWSANAAQRPTFAQIVAMIESHAPAADERIFTLTQPPPATSTLSIDDGELTESDVDEHFELGIESARSVSRLKNQWERFCVEPSARGGGATGIAQRRSAAVSNVHRLQQQLDANGYVSQAARSLAAAKSAATLRDSVVLARTANISQRQCAFRDDSQAMSDCS